MKPKIFKLFFSIAILYSFKIFGIETVYGELPITITNNYDGSYTLASEFPPVNICPPNDAYTVWWGLHREGDGFIEEQWDPYPLNKVKFKVTEPGNYTIKLFYRSFENHGIFPIAWTTYTDHIDYSPSVNPFCVSCIDLNSPNKKLAYTSPEPINVPCQADNFNVGSQGNIDLKSSISITLNPGFSTENETQFQASIEPVTCVNGSAGIHVKSLNEILLHSNNDSVENFLDNKVEIEYNPINLFPNPNNGYFTVSISSDNLKSIYVYNSLGSEVYVVLSSAEKQFKIDISSKHNGVYLVKVQDGEKIEMLKVVIQ